jgi:hypothetical protein
VADARAGAVGKGAEVMIEAMQSFSEAYMARSCYQDKYYFVFFTVPKDRKEEPAPLAYHGLILGAGANVVPVGGRTIARDWVGGARASETRR